jgi:aminoglycoside phosphotransferase (APT) family kinase protein
MPVPQRDLELTRKRLTEWFATTLTDAEDLRLSELTGPGATGFSSDTLMFELTCKQGGKEHREDLVARIEPSGLRVFPEYDLDQQFRVLQILGEKTDVPVPRVLWQEKSAHVLGHPFFIMQKVEGRVPPDSPPYHAEGWVAEIRPEERAELWWSGLEALMRIHSLDYQALGLGFLSSPTCSGSHRTRICPPVGRPWVGCGKTGPGSSYPWASAGATHAWATCSSTKIAVSPCWTGR